MGGRAPCPVAFHDYVLMVVDVLCGGPAERQSSWQTEGNSGSNEIGETLRKAPI